jgi:hypothetical protein
MKSVGVNEDKRRKQRVLMRYKKRRGVQG